MSAPTQTDSPSSKQTWDTRLYDGAHSFVWKLASDLIPLLSPQPGERILDLGCGTGHLTAQIAASGAEVMGLDASPDMIGQARQNFPKITFVLADASDFSLAEPFDALFSNAAIHWIRDQPASVRCFRAALKSGGRFVAEFGGTGNVKQVCGALEAALRRRGIETSTCHYYPSISEYSSLLESNGFEVRTAHLFERPTKLEGGENGLREWYEMFRGPALRLLPEDERGAALREVEGELRPALYQDHAWFADYRRLRVTAVAV